jgi:hypothetical protein
MSGKETHTWKAAEYNRLMEWLRPFGYGTETTLNQSFVGIIRDCSQIAADADTNFDAREQILSRFGLK